MLQQPHLEHPFILPDYVLRGIWKAALSKRSGLLAGEGSLSALCRSLNSPVPIFIGMPIIMHSDTPETGRWQMMTMKTSKSLIAAETLTADRILLSKIGGVEKMVGCFLKRGQHEDALLHLSQAKSGDAQNLPLREASNQPSLLLNVHKPEQPPFSGSHLVGHEVGQKHDVAPVDAHPVVDHRVLNLIDDCGPSGLDSQSLLNLQTRSRKVTPPCLELIVQEGLKKSTTYFIRVVGSSAASINSMCGHDTSHVIPLHQELVLVPAALFINVNDSSGYLGNTLYHHLWNDNRATTTVKTRSGETAFPAIRSS